MHIQLPTHSLKPRLNELSFLDPKKCLFELAKPLTAPFISSLKIAKSMCGHYNFSHLLHCEPLRGRSSTKLPILHEALSLGLNEHQANE